MEIVAGCEAEEAARRAGLPDDARAIRRYLADLDVQAEIARLRKRKASSTNVAAQARARVAARSVPQVRRQSPPPPDPPPPLNGDIIEPPTGEPFSRKWIRQRLMRAARIALGEEERVTTKVITIPHPHGGEPLVKAVMIQARETDLAAAARALELLRHEADRLQARGMLPDDDEEIAMRDAAKEIAAQPDHLRGDTLEALHEALRERTEETPA